MAQSVSPSSDLDRLDFEEIKRFIIRRWTLVVAITMGCIMLAGIVCVTVTPVYTATSQILLDPRKQHIFGQDTVTPDAVLDSSIVDSQIPIILSTRLLAKVVTKENLADDPEFSGPNKQGMLDRLFGVFRPAKAVKVDVPSFDGIDPKLQPVILRLFDRIDVTRLARSYVLSLSVSSRDPEKAMRLANSLAETYVEDRVGVRAKSVQQAAAFFEDRLGNLREQVRTSEQAVADFRKKHDLTTTTMDGKITVGEEQLTHLNEQLALISADTAEKRARFDQGARIKLGGESLESIPEVIRSPVMTQLRTQQADLTRRAADLSAMYGPSYPAITQIRAQKSGLDKAIGIEMKRLVSVLKNDYEIAKAREDSMRKTIAGLSDISGGDNEVGVKLRELERTNLANKALFENFLNRAKITQEQSTFEEPDARLISPALEPASPSSPKIKLILPAAAVVGLLLGLGIAALVDVMRKRGTGSVPTARANAFILGRIPDVAARRGARTDCTAYMENNPSSGFAQGIEALASKLATKEAGKPGHAAALAPLSQGEGATSMALCIAAAAGKAGKRVLVIDADQARRGLSTALGVTGAPGFGEIISGDLSATKVVLKQPHFTAIPAGQKPLDTKSAAKRIRLFLSEARTRFDLILIDTPAFDAGPDALALTGLVDGMALVACWDHLMRENFISAIDALADKPNFLGIVLNKAAVHEDENLAMAS